MVAAVVLSSPQVPIAASDTGVRGFCAVAPAGGDCNNGQLGSWQLTGTETQNTSAAAMACLERCHGCARCRYISVSLADADCSWYHRCSLDRLRMPEGSHLSYHVKNTRRIGHPLKSRWSVGDEETGCAPPSKPGHCGVVYAGDASCTQDVRGTHANVADEASCLRLCGNCSNCAFVSYSAQRHECDWHRWCDLQYLGPETFGHCSRRVKWVPDDKAFGMGMVASNMSDIAAHALLRRSLPASGQRRRSHPAARLLPRIVWQTHETRQAVSAEAQAARARVQRLSGAEWEWRFHDAAERQAFIRRWFARPVFDAYMSLRLGVARSDFWRYCVLLVHGGVYLDVDAELFAPLDAFFQANDSAVLSCERYPLFQEVGGPDTSGEEVLAITRHISPLEAARATLPGLAEADHSALTAVGYNGRLLENKNPLKVANWMLACEPGHVLMRAMVQELTGLVTAWVDTEATMRLSMLSRVVWTSGPASFTLVFFRLAAARQLASHATAAAHKAQDDAMASDAMASGVRFAPGVEFGRMASRKATVAYTAGATDMGRVHTYDTGYGPYKMSSLHTA